MRRACMRGADDVGGRRGRAERVAWRACTAYIGRSINITLDRARLPRHSQHALHHGSRPQAHRRSHLHPHPRLWGNPAHLNHLRDTLLKRHTDERLHVLVVKSNSEYNTYDGIEVGGERIVHEIEQSWPSWRSRASRSRRSASSATPSEGSWPATPSGSSMRLASLTSSSRSTSPPSPPPTSVCAPPPAATARHVELSRRPHAEHVGPADVHDRQVPRHGPAATRHHGGST
ncbi:hypothetical protein MRB53_039957 [Persea americana]|nr:hypothetical protein MRB53_039957 [Persea americana]